TSGKELAEIYPCPIEAGAQDYLVKQKIDAWLLEHTLKSACLRQQARIYETNKKQYYIDFAENTSDIIQSVDENGRICFVNQVWLNTLKYKEEDVIGKNIFSFIHPDSRQTCMTFFQAVMQ